MGQAPSYNFPLRLRWLYPLLLLLAFSWDTTAFATVAIRGLQWEPTPSRLRCIVYTEAPIQIDTKDYVTDPSRGLFYVDLFNVSLAKPFDKDFYELNNPFLRAMQFKMFPEQKVLRIHFWPQAGVQQHVTVEQNPPRILIDLIAPGASPADAAATATPPVAHPVPTLAPQGQETPATSLAPPEGTPLKMTDYQSAPKVSLTHDANGGHQKIIVIDPGHGGKDGGATGCIRVGNDMVHEKELNFEIARRLAGLVQNAHNNIRFVMTRTSDTYVSLTDRVRFAENIAKPGNGDCLYVSIHNNWAHDASAYGVEFYYLDENPAKKSQAQLELERLENDAQYEQDLKPNSILWNIFMSLEQEKIQERKTQGRELCGLLEWAFRQNNYFRTVDRGVKGASFFVLKNFNMPAVLVEVGFVSNPEECRKLTQADFQYNAAVGIFNAINVYFKRQDPAFQPMMYPYR